MLAYEKTEEKIIRSAVELFKKNFKTPVRIFIEEDNENFSDMICISFCHTKENALDQDMVFEDMVECIRNWDAFLKGYREGIISPK